MADLFDPEEEDVAKLVEAARREVRYQVTDFPVELIVSKFREEAEAEGDIYIPEYQRSLAWNADQQSYFIESLILRVPVPPIFFYDVEGKLEVVDGSQRIRSLVAFAKGGFALSDLEKLNVLNGFSFEQLPPAVQRRLNNTPVRSFVLDQTTDHSTRVDLFRRLNTSGKRLRDAEIRKGAFKGPFLDLIIKSASSEVFHAVTPHMTGGMDPSSERQELVTRFFVYGARYLDFRHDVRKFLDDAVEEFNLSCTAEQLAGMEAEFQSTMSFIGEHYPRAFYRTETGKRVARVRFEGVAVGTALALRQEPNLNVQNTEWLRSAEFEKLVRTDASNSAPKLRGRIEFVRDRLLHGE